MVHKNSEGYIEVIVGPMFAGKSEELIRRTRLLDYANIKYQAFKPKIDIRTSKNEISSRAGTKIKAVTVNNVTEIETKLKDETQAIIIDEIQFFENDIIDLIDKLANLKKRVIVAGLDTDFNDNPFGPLPFILSKAEYITKLRGICMICGNWGTKTKKIIDSKELIDIGDLEKYEIRCRKCWNKA